MLKSISRLWHGEIALNRAFWKYGVLVPIILVAVSISLDWTVMISLLLFGFSGPSAPDLVLNGAVVVPVTMRVITLSYQLIACVGVWRSAERYTGRLVYTILARGVLAVFLVVTAGYTYLAVSILVFKSY